MHCNWPIIVSRWYIFSRGSLVNRWASSAIPFDSNLAAERVPFDSLTTHDAHHSLPLRSRCANQGHRAPALQLDDLRACQHPDRSGTGCAVSAHWRSGTSMVAHATRRIAVAAAAALFGRKPCEGLLAWWNRQLSSGWQIRWLSVETRIPRNTAWLSALIGTFSHLGLDSIMHTDVEALWPLISGNSVQGLVSLEMLHGLCVAQRSWRC